VKDGARGKAVSEQGILVLNDLLTNMFYFTSEKDKPIDSNNEHTLISEAERLNMAVPNRVYCGGYRSSETAVSPSQPMF
jgi:hypothetical protein